MPQGQSNAPRSVEEQEEADRAAGWDTRWGPAPEEHGLPVPGLETTDVPPTVTSW
jgi:hypothetical protein